jgi:hypothetical protein
MNEMDRYLDGELSSAEIGEARRAEAESWDRLLDAFRAATPPRPAPDWLESRVMAEIEALPEPGSLARAWRWLMRPQPLTLRPAVVALGAAAVVSLLVLMGDMTPDPVGSPPPGAVASLVYVEFSLQAPDARSVSVGGDFDGWEGAHPLEDPDGDGVWSGRVPLEPGVHDYMFLVDGGDWVTDPGATRYHDDGFGNRNAVLAVALPSV